MTWQDELRQLDEDLAAGRVSADDYRRRRDELTAQEGQADQPATGQPAQTPGVAATSETIITESVKSPFPPAFRWETAPPETSETSETTQIIRPGSGDQTGQQESTGDESNEPTQVVQAGQYGDSASTQVFQTGTPPPGIPQQPPYPAQQQPFAPQPPGGAFPPSPPGGAFPPGAAPGATQQVPQWGYRPDPSAPPWAGADLPPVPDQQNLWARQGPEFAPPQRRGGRAAKIIIPIVVVVLLAGVAVGAWLIYGRDGGSEPTTPPPPPTSAAPTTPTNPLAAADIGGEQNRQEFDNVDDLESVGLLTNDELGILQQAAAGDSTLLISEFDEGRATILISELGSADEAAEARDQLTDLQIGFGFTERLASPPGVNVVQLPDTADRPMIRAIYASEGTVVRIEMAGAAGDDLEDIASRFEDILDQQTADRPPDA